jgi:AraC family transcriptional regulator
VERVEVQRQGATAVKAVVGAFGLQRLRFAGGHSIPWFEPEWGYLAIVLDGTMQKTFSSATWSLPRDSFATLPPGAGHSTAFGVKPTHVLTLYPTTDESALLIARFLWERRQIIAPGSATLGRRLALELDAADTSWGLAAEGLVLQVLAMGEREASGQPRRGAAWLATVVELLRERTPHAPSLTELAAEGGVHPGHLARAFRQRFGVTVCQYSRSLRLEWAASQLAGGTPLAEIALAAGFADQSHFTREFRRHFGVTPGRYRELSLRRPM